MNYKKLTQKLTGMSDAQYRKAYKDIAARTRNYNAIAGTTYNPAQTLYLSHRYAGNLSAGVANILATPATRARYAGQTVERAIGEKATRAVTAAATSAVLDRWSKFIERSELDAKMKGTGAAAVVAKQLRDGVITPAQANSLFQQLRDLSATKRETDPAFKY